MLTQPKFEPTKTQFPWCEQQYNAYIAAYGEWYQTTYEGLSGKIALITIANNTVIFFMTLVGLVMIYRTCQRINQLSGTQSSDYWAQYTLHVLVLSFIVTGPFLSYFFSWFNLVEPFTALMIYTLIAVIIWR